MTTSLRVTRPRTRRVAAAAAAALMALGLGLTGCSSDQDSAASSDSAGGSAGGDGGSDVAAPEKQQGGAPGVAEDSGGSGGSDSSGGSTRTSARVLPDDGRDIVYTGSVTVRVRDVATAARRVETMTLAMGGVVFSEQTSQLPGKRRLGQADLTLRVRSLLAEADTIGEVVQIESELARREADLESLQAQLARLQDVTDLATLEVTLLARQAPAPAPVDDEEFGFLVGLRGGLAALLGIVVVGLTVLGALLPFALVAGLLGWPAYVIFRRTRARRTTRPVAPADA